MTVRVTNTNKIVCDQFRVGRASARSRNLDDGRTRVTRRMPPTLLLLITLAATIREAVSCVPEYDTLERETKCCAF